MQTERGVKSGPCITSTEHPDPAQLSSLGVTASYYHPHPLGHKNLCLATNVSPYFLRNSGPVSLAIIGQRGKVAV